MCCLAPVPSHQINPSQDRRKGVQPGHDTSIACTYVVNYSRAHPEYLAEHLPYHNHVSAIRYREPLYLPLYLNVAAPNASDRARRFPVSCFIYDLPRPPPSIGNSSRYTHQGDPGYTRSGLPRITLKIMPRI